ncbi:hypothetical protein K8R43_01000 [archaeon]|nr:hypothetical protein [archaeon]
MTWNQLKQHLLAKLEKEGCDPEVKPYLDLINSVPELITSSSCYGRIVFIDLPGFSKKNANFLWKIHRTTTFEEAWEQLNKAKGEFIWLKNDSLILHISCKNIETATKFLRVKANAGLKRGGVFSIAPERIQIELEGTYKLGLPVKKKEILIDESYFRLIIEEANKRMEKTAESWERFTQEFEKEFKKA